MKIDPFFQAEGIDTYAIVSLTDLPDADRSDARHLVPGARSVIVFGREVPVPVYGLSPAEKTWEIHRIAEETDQTAIRLAERLLQEQVPAAPVPFLLPVRVENGQVQGIIRLKRIAAAGGLGTIGRSGILLSPRFGTRLVLSGVVTAMNGVIPRTTPVADLCRNCGLCVRACPGRAIGPDGVDAFRCWNVSPWVPPSWVPFGKWLLRRKTLQRLAAPLAPVIARHATMRCNRCVTVCPNFRGGEQSR
jgi:epoxyqueuosine reductase